MNTLFTGLVYAFLGVFLLICCLGLAVIAIGLRDAVRNRQSMIQAQKQQRRKVMARALVAVKPKRGPK
jgi:hypothetical protein